MKRINIFLAALLASALVAGPASAVPKLQTYIVGSDFQYNYAPIESDTWVTTSGSFDLKVVGYWHPIPEDPPLDMVLAPPTYDYLDVCLMISAPTDQSGTVWINGIEINSFCNNYNRQETGLDWNTKGLFRKDMNLAFYKVGRIDNKQANAWNYDHGLIHERGWGDEALLDVVVRGFSWTHFDAIGIDSHGKRYRNPHSHDSSYFATPEPGTLSLLGLGLLGLVPILRRNR
ncbi:MAG: choice-of-anchor N protein [Candidatus Krumholzibacteriota bacterium]|nr:choice-of-anchor N protein [Candidatus Krumholzibacteriota bacterium]